MEQLTALLGAPPRHPDLVPVDLMMASLAADPQSGTGYRALLDLLRRRPAADDARRAILRELAERYPDAPDPWLELATLHYSRNAYRRAEGSARRGAPARPLRRPHPRPAGDRLSQVGRSEPQARPARARGGGSGARRRPAAPAAGADPAGQASAAGPGRGGAPTCGRQPPLTWSRWRQRSGSGRWRWRSTIWRRIATSRTSTRGPHPRCGRFWPVRPAPSHGSTRTRRSIWWLTCRPIAASCTGVCGSLRW